MKTEFYDKLYICENEDFQDKAFEDKHLVWVSKNWDYMFDEKPTNSEYEALENYTLVFCESDAELKKFDSSSHNIYDYSFEFEHPSLLVETEYLKQCLN
jgi:hypothetical protein